MNLRHLATASVLSVLAACSSPPAALNVSVPRPTLINGVEVEVTGLLNDDDGGVHGFAGVAMNQSGESLLSCTITLNMLDVEGARVGTTRVSTQGLAAGRAWNFHAYPEDGVPANVHRVEVANVTAVTESGRALAGQEVRVALPPTSLVRSLQIDVKDCLAAGPGLYYVHGQVTNQSAQALSTCDISFDLIARDGSRLGSARTSHADFAGGETWHFEATAALETEGHVVEVRLGTVDAH